ncbi:MAG: hypothetical protein AB8B57_11220 [Congregibacter sp.]
MNTARSLFIVAEGQRLSGKVSITDLALSHPTKTLVMLEWPIPFWELRPC